MVKVTVLGSGREVGRSAVLAESEGKTKERFLMDFGIEVQHSNIPRTPKKPLTAALLTHAHLDHSGLFPLLYKKGFQIPSIMTQGTLDLSILLLKDSIKVQSKRGQTPFFLGKHIQQYYKATETPFYNDTIEFSSSKATLVDAGHVQGSSSILLETGGKRILYTGDINFVDSKLVSSARKLKKDVDVIICESTYSRGNHPDRTRLEDKLKERIQEIYYNDGIVLLPAFAVGRTQELLIMLYELGFPIYLDGMAIEATEISLRNPEFLRYPKKLKKAFSYARKVKDKKVRKTVLDEPCIIITTAGMLSGGPVHHYIKKLYNRQDCGIILSGYQVEDTIGRRLMDTGRFQTEGSDLKLKMSYEQMDFSAHAGRDDLIKFLTKSSPEKVILVHGDETEKFAKELRGMGLDVEAPKNDDVIKF